MGTPTITACHCFLDSFETGDTISIDTTDATSVIVAHSTAFTTATLSGNSVTLLNYVTTNTPTLAYGLLSVFTNFTQSAAEDFVFTMPEGNQRIWLVSLKDTVTSGTTYSDFFLAHQSDQSARTTWEYDRTAAAADELVVFCSGQFGVGATFSVTSGTEFVPTYSFDAVADPSGQRIGYKVSTGAGSTNVEFTASAYTNTVSIGFVPKYQAPTSASITLTERDGTRRQDLTNIKWAWFDETDPQNFTAPTDTGSAEVTDVEGLIEVPLPGTSLIPGQRGCLALSTSDDVDLGLYKLRVK